MSWSLKGFCEGGTLYKTAKQVFNPNSVEKVTRAGDCDVEKSEIADVLLSSAGSLRHGSRDY